VRLRGLERHGISQEAVVRDVEAALRDGFIGFQELVIRDREDAPTAFVPRGGIRRARRPVYRRALEASELPNASMRAVEIDGQPILLAHVDGEVYAVADRCGDSPLPLHFGRLERHVIHCSWHGCRYDVRTGTRIDADGARLAVFPVREQDGEIAVAVGVEPAPAS
jgi:nitrite reductase/ring-hydroxylating ferredoxin subunit